MNVPRPSNPALNLEAFAVQTPDTAPPPIHALYLRDGQYDGTTRSEVAATFTAFKAQAYTNRLALFFHGGLVDKASGQQSAAYEFAAYLGYAFPLFFIWESGFGEVLSHHLPLIFAETIFGRVLFHATNALAPKVAPAKSEGVTAEDEASAPRLVLNNDEIDAFMDAVKNDSLIQNEAVAIARTSGADLKPGVTAEAVVQSPRTLLSPELVGSIRGAVLEAGRTGAGSAETLEVLPFGIGVALHAAFAVSKAAVPVILNTIKRFARGRDHGLPCTIVEEILRALYLANFGSAVWEEMKKETVDAFGADSGKFGGTAVVEEICQLVREKPGTKITLVGHSTGGVYIGNFLRHVDLALRGEGDSTTQFDILLLAPANTDDFFVSAYGMSRISGLRIFQMKDEAEKQDHLLSKDVDPENPSILGKIYPRSLLYLVSGVCEYFEGQGGTGVHSLDGCDMPILGMDRYYQQQTIFSGADYPNVQRVRTVFPQSAASPKFARVLSPTDASAPEGFRSAAVKHGNFPGDGPTIESLRFCFKQGL